MARQAVRTTLKHILWFCAYGALGVVLTLLVVFVLYLEGRPDLDAWHRAELDEEFTAGSRVSNFDEYLALEDRLFAQLDERVYDRTGPAGDDRVNRYKRGSLSDPQRWTPDWNRSFEMPVAAPRASVLLLHGLSDSPYSLRALGERLHAEGAHLLGLRIPGHGTAPSGLVTVRWQDMAAAVRLAVAHLAERNPGRPLHVVGYSNGAALAVWQARLGYLPGLDKLAWNDILPEYDPFKYGSFAVNAGDVSHRLTAEIQRRIGQLADGGKLGAMPPILAFSSAVDATVLAPALVANLFDRLPPGPHELVLFDINHVIGIEPLLSWSPDEMVRVLQRNAGRGFAFSLVTNADARSRDVIEPRWRPGSDAPVETPLGLEWPADLYSLSHVALPFPPGDPLYGGRPESPSPGVSLGDIVRRGERGVLAISPAAMLRLRWNPFYDYQERRVLEFLALDGPEGDR